MNNSSLRGSFALWALLISILLLLVMKSAMSFERANLVVTVSIIAAPPCVINNERPIEVDFGNSVMTNRVDGKYAMRDVEYNLDCRAASFNAIKMSIQGQMASGGKGLHTNNENLAIAFVINGDDMPVNSWINFTGLPKLQAVPIRNGKGVLAGGEFSTTATMKIDYQ